MQRMGLTHAELRAYHRALRTHHSVKIKVAILDLEENPITSITPRVLGGQVTFDARRRRKGQPASVTRMLGMQFLDPRNQLELDSRVPSDGALFLDRMVKVFYSVWVGELGRWVSCQVFTGVPWKLSRDNALVTIEAHGKDRLAMRPVWQQFSREPGKKRVDVLHDFLAQRAGEGRFAFPKLDVELGHPFSVGRQQIMWDRALDLGDSMDRQLFYPGTGICTLRALPTDPVVVFRCGDGGSMLSEPAIDTSVDNFVNTVLTHGRNKVKPTTSRLDPHNPMSAERLIRNGVAGVMSRFEDNDHLRNPAEEQRYGDRILDQAGREVVTYAYNVLPHPHLDELDMAAFETTDGELIRHRLTQWALPLTAEGNPPMTVGYDRLLVPRRGPIRRR